MDSRKSIVVAIAALFLSASSCVDMNIVGPELAKELHLPPAPVPTPQGPYPAHWHHPEQNAYGGSAFSLVSPSFRVARPSLGGDTLEQAATSPSFTVTGGRHEGLQN